MISKELHKNIKFGIYIAILILLLLVVGPFNIVHGARRESTIRGELPNFTAYDISNQKLVQEFSPKYAHLRGVDLLLLNSGSGNSGSIFVHITNQKGNIVYEKEYDISKISPGEWVKVELSCNLKPGKAYEMFIEADTKESLSALVINASLDVDENLNCYVDEERIDGGMAIGYYYQKTFSLISRSIICFAIILYILALLAKLFFGQDIYKKIISYLWNAGDLTSIAYGIGMVCLIIVTIFMHIYKISSLPFGINIDEMGMGYDAYCLANYGVDRYQLSWPVYLINWGSGQNALYTFWAAILIKIFGYSVTILRVPSICNAFMIWFFGIKIIKMKWNKKYHIVLYSILFLIIPQFLILTRYGLESLLMLGFSTAFLYFLLYAVEKNKWYWYSITGIVGGIMLYTYAISYLVTIVFLIISLLYLIRLGRLKFRNVLALGIPLGILAFPLILEQLIGIFDWPQMQLGIFTISKMPYRYRGGDINFKHVSEDFWKTIYTIFIGDDTDYSSFLSVQTFYWMSIPYIVVGIIHESVQTILSIKNRKWNVSSLIMIWFWCMFGIGCIMGGKGPTCFRLNAIYFCVLYCLISGILCAISAVQQQKIFFFGIATENGKQEYAIRLSQKFVMVSGRIAIILSIIYFSFFVDLYFYERVGKCFTLNWNTYEEPLQVLHEQGNDIESKITYLPDVKSIYTLGTLRPSPYEICYKDMIDKYLAYVLDEEPYADSYYNNYVLTGKEYDMENIDLTANYVVNLSDRAKAVQFEKLGFQVMKTATHYVCFR